MSILTMFTFLMNSESIKAKNNNNLDWLIDERKYLSRGEVKKLRNKCLQVKLLGLNNMRFSLIRNWFMVELGLNTVLRVNEMASLRFKNLLIDDTRSSIVITGKGNKKRVIWISAKFKRTCLNYLKYRARFGYSIDQESFILNNLKGKRISRRALQKFFKKIIRGAGLPDYYSIHCLRHTYTTFLLIASNQNYRFAQQQLGHSSIQTTQVYAGVVEHEGKKALEKLYIK